MSDIILIVIIAALVLVGIMSYRKKLRNGCCSTGDEVRRIEAGDSNPDHYSYHTVLKVDGMHCHNCEIRVENVFNQQEGMMAKANARRGTVDVYSKEKPDDGTMRALVVRSGYTLESMPAQ